MTRVRKTVKTRDAEKPARRRVTQDDRRFASFAGISKASGIVIPAVEKVLLDRRKVEAQEYKRRTNIMFPSEMSKNDWCPRATYYRMSGLPDPNSKPSFTLENVFAEGNSIHSKWQGWLSETGKLWGDWRCSRCGEYVKDSLKPSDYFGGSCVGVGWVKLGTSHFERDMIAVATDSYPHEWRYKEVTLKSTSLPVSGHADGALVQDDILIELKSLGIGSLRFEAPTMLETHTHDVRGKKIIDVDGIWRDFHRPLAAHVRQGNLYLWMAKEMGMPFNRISFIYEFKSNQRSKEFVIPYSQEIVQPMLDTANVVLQALALKERPPCQSKDGSCSQCRPYKEA